MQLSSSYLPTISVPYPTHSLLLQFFLPILLSLSSPPAASHHPFYLPCISHSFSLTPPTAPPLILILTSSPLSYSSPLIQPQFPTVFSNSTFHPSSNPSSPQSSSYVELLLSIACSDENHPLITEAGSMQRILAK